MRNKKGFTLIELLAVILIIAILLLIAIPGVTKFLNKGTTEYYKSMENNIIIAGREYLNDYRSLLPKKIGNVTVIELNELVSNNYIDEVVDDKNNTCEARMTVKKVNKKDYEYYTCLICDGYQTEGENCSYTEEDNVTPETIYYSIEVKEPGHFVVYQGDDFTVPTAKAYYKKDQLDKQLVDGNVVGYPKIIDTNKLGKTTVTYSYQGAKNSITVEVKDNVKPSVPQVVLKYDNVNGKKYGGNWYNGNIYVEFKSTDYSKNNIVGSGIAYYEISEDEKTWNKISGNNTTITESSKTAEGTTYYVRAVDKAGNTGTTNTYMVKIDKKVPGCVLASNDSIGSGNWHKAKFQLDLKTQDNKTNISGNNYYLDTNSNPTTSRNSLSISNETAETINYGKICSGAGTCSYCNYTVRLDMTKPTVKYDLAGGDTTTPKYYNTTKTVTITGSDSNFKNMIVNSYKNNTKQTGKSTTTTSKTYSVSLDSDGDWIVYTDVYDKAGNKQDKVPKDKNGTYLQRYIIDKDPPTCDFEVSGTKGNDPWYRSSVKVSLKTNEASPKGTWISHTTITAEGTTVVEGSVTDNAGNVGTCSKEIKIDSISPKCTDSGDSIQWTSSDRTITYGCSDTGGSGCHSSYKGGSAKFTTTTKTATIAAYTIKDNAGNSVTCPARTANVYVDKEKPTCTLTATDTIGSGNWHKADFNLNLKEQSNISGNDYYLDTNSSPSTKTKSQPISSNTSGTTYNGKVCSGAGLCTTCSYLAKLDETTPTCTLSASDGIGSGSWHKANFNINVSKGSNISGNDYYLDTNPTPKTEQSSKLISNNTSGTTYYGRICSGAGKCNNCSSSYLAKLDKTPPTCTLTASDGIDSGKWHKANYTLNLSGGGNISGNDYYLDTNSTPTTSRTSLTISTETGGTYYGRVYSGSGNYTTCSYVNKLDKVRPIVSYNVAGGTYTDYKTVTVTAADTNFSYMYVHVYHNDSYIESKSTYTTSDTFQVALDSAGRWEIYTYAADKAENSQNQTPDNGAGWYYQSYTISPCQYAIGKVWEFPYRGYTESFPAPCAGTYKLEVFGAQVGTIQYDTGIGNGGLGGYSWGNISLNSGSQLYVTVGGQGSGGITTNEEAITYNGGYNGGGIGYYVHHAGLAGMGGAAGGGATHISKTQTLLKNTATSNLYIVAGGGGGGGVDGNYYPVFGLDGGTGGGTAGGNGFGVTPDGNNLPKSYAIGYTAGTASSGGISRDGQYGGSSEAGSYGQGGAGLKFEPYYGGAGGGGGYYGGGGSVGSASAGGGSGYIGGVTGEKDMQNGKQAGNGYARITLISY